VGTTDPHPAAVQVKTSATTFLGDVASIGLGWDHTCAVMNDATLRCWGRNQYGQLGLGVADEDPHTFPASVAGLTGVKSVDGGLGHTCVLKSNATLRCWGDNGAGQTGNGDSGVDPLLSPTTVVKGTGTLKNVTSFAAGAFHTCAISNGKAFCWGDNSNGELGQGDPAFTIQSSDVALRVKADASTLFGSATRIVAGDSVTCILKSDVTVWCTGYAEYGQIGYSETPDTYVFFPEQVAFP
jgi:alpha-tubulin suppressor-like RCC1 family protein